MERISRDPLASPYVEEIFVCSYVLGLHTVNFDATSRFRLLDNLPALSAISMASVTPGRPESGADIQHDRHMDIASDQRSIDGNQVSTKPSKSEQVTDSDKVAPVVISSQSSLEVHDNDIPDGGTAAWLVILGAWCASFCAYGWINSELSSSN